MTLTAAEIAFSGNIYTLCLLRTHESSYCLPVFVTFVSGDLYTVFASSPSSVSDRQSVFCYCHFRGSAQRRGKQKLGMGRGGGGGRGSILWV